MYLTHLLTYYTDASVNNIQPAVIAIRKEVVLVTTAIASDTSAMHAGTRADRFRIRRRASRVCANIAADSGLGLGRTARTDAQVQLP